MRILCGSSWVGGEAAAAIVAPPPPDPGTGPETPPDPGTPPDEIPEETLPDRLSGGLALWHHGATNGSTITDLIGTNNGSVTTGTTIALQPSLCVDDPYNSMLYAGDAYATIPADADLAAASGGVLVVFQFQPAARWLTVVNRFGDSWSNAGGFAIAISYSGGEYKVRAQLNDGSQNIVLESAAIDPGVAYGAALTWGAAGLKLYVGNADSAAEEDTDASTAGAQGSYPVIIGANGFGETRFAGAIDLVALYDGQPTEETVLADLAEVKDAGVVWANDGAVTLQAEETTVFDPRPTALVDSTTPTAVVTVQPSNATATAESNGTITIEAGSSAGSSTNGRYTLDGSTAAVLGVTVTAIPAQPASSYHLNPFKAAAATHIPIGSSATFESASDPATDDMLNIAGIVIPNRDASSASYPFGGAYVAEASSGDTEYTVTAAPGETPFGDIPVTLKIPEHVKTLTATTGDRTCMITAPDGVTQYNFYHFRWDGSKFVAGGCRTYQLDGLGHGTTAGDRVGTSASGMAHFGTFYRPEWYHDKSIVVPCMIHLVLPRCATYSRGLSTGLELPATTRDSGWETINSGNIPYGSVFSFVHGFNLNSLGLSADGLRTLAQPIYDYGMIPIDGRGCTSYAALRCTSGNQTHQNLPEAAAAVLAADIEKIRPHLRRITNGEWFDGQTVRGGGTPRAANRAFDA